MKFCVLAILLLVPVFAPAQIIVPITQTLLPDGDIRYSVPIRVGNSDVINALLDTGSTGLRILPNAIAPDTYTDTGFSSLYAYGSGEDLNGTIATAPIAIGGAATDSPVSIEMVKTIGCMDFAPDCPAGTALPAKALPRSSAWASRPPPAPATRKTRSPISAADAGSLPSLSLAPPRPAR
jgi:hypothetical protein